MQSYNHNTNETSNNVIVFSETSWFLVLMVPEICWLHNSLYSGTHLLLELFWFLNWFGFTACELPVNCLWTACELPLNCLWTASYLSDCFDQLDIIYRPRKTGISKDLHCLIEEMLLFLWKYNIFLFLRESDNIPINI